MDRSDLALGPYFGDASLQPDHDFIVYPDRGLRWTYGGRPAHQLAKGLLAIGIGKGDHVGSGPATSPTG